MIDVDVNDNFVLFILINHIAPLILVVAWTFSLLEAFQPFFEEQLNLDLPIEPIPPETFPMAEDFYLYRNATGLTTAPMEADPEDLQENTKKAVFLLIKAAARGSLDDVNSLLRMGVDPNDSCNAKTALCEAVSRGRYTCVTALLEAGADPNITTDNGVSPLMLALSRTQRMCANALMDHGHVRLNAVDSRHKTLLMYAASGGHFHFTQVLLSNYEKGIEPLKLRDDGQESVLTYAAINGHRHYLQDLRPMLWFAVDVVKCAANDDSIELRRLLEEDRRDPNQTDFGGLTALMVCCMMDHRECLKVLRDFPIELNKWDDTGRLAIHYAAGCGNSQCMEMLIELGASVSLASRQRESVLSLAAKNGFEKCVNVALSDMKAELTRSLFPPDNNGHINVECNPMFGFGHDHGQCPCNIETLDVSGKTALMYASEKGFYTIVIMLIDNGAISTTRSSFINKNALIYAASAGRSAIVSLLLNRRAKLNAADRTGGSALYYAASEGHLDCVLVLLRAGATINTTAMFKNSALAVALDRGHTECAETMIRDMSRDELAMTDEHGMNWILFATKSGDLKCLRLIFKAGLNWMDHSVDYRGNTLLMYAAAHCHMEMMDFLVRDLGLIVDERNFLGLNALGVAVFYRAPDPIIRYLIRKKSDVQANSKGTRSCPLFYACWTGNASHIRILLAAGADICHKDQEGESCIYFVSKAGNAEAVRVIFDAERSKGLLVADDKHKRALQCAIDWGRTRVIDEFLKNGIFDWKWYRHFINKLRGKARVLIKSLVTLGITPGVFRHHYDVSSPLLFALEYYDITTAKYLICNLYFTDFEYRRLLKNKSIRMTLERMNNGFDSNVRDGLTGKIIAKNTYSNPLPLTTLSFLKISTAIGLHCGLSQRADAVETLPLPQHFKTKLAFQEPVAKLCHFEWQDIDLERRVRRSGRCRRVYSLFEECTQVSMPFTSSCMHECQRLSCACDSDGLSYYDGRELQEDRPFRPTIGTFLRH